MTAAIDPVRQYFSFSYVFVALLPMAYGAAAVLRTRVDERAGLLDAQLAAGVARWRPLAARTAEAAAGALGLLVLGSTVQAATALSALSSAPSSGAMKWALWAPLTQAPGVLAVVGLAGLVVGAAPVMTGLVWFAVAWSGFAVLLGPLARIPTAARRIALLGHLPVDPPAVTAPAALLALGWVMAVAAGCAAMRTRDVVVG